MTAYNPQCQEEADFFGERPNDGPPPELTLEDLKAMPEFKIFATGVIEDSPKGINMMNTGRMLQWVACRGGTYDWAIYCWYESDGWSDERIHDEGEKVTSEENIRKLVPCTNKAFLMYRY